MVKLILCASFVFALSCIAASGELRVNQVDFNRFEAWRTLAKNHQDQKNAILPLEQDQVATRSGKLIEWDDDDSENSLTFSSKEKASPTNKWQAKGANWASKNGAGRLIYHGRLEPTSRNGSVAARYVDGLQLRVDTHMPLVISRRRLPTSKWTLATKPDRWSLEHSNYAQFDQTNARLAIYSADDETSKAVSEPTTSSTTEAATLTPDGGSASLQESSASDWRPILVPSSSARTRRSGDSLRSGGSTAKSSSGDKSSWLDFKWKPIAGGQRETATSSPAARFDEAPRMDSIISNKGSLDIAQKQHSKRKLAALDEPFEDEGDCSDPFDEQRSDSAGAKSSSSEPKLMDASAFASNKWKPLVDPSESAASSPRVANGTAVTSAKLASNSTSGEQQHRSASDLNYIYSSQAQPVVQSSGSAYYSNYLVPSSTPQVPAPELPIIDTTSGQTPEMVALVDRMPSVGQEAGVSEAGAGYSLPVAAANFQPARAPPNRQSSGYYTAGYSGPSHETQPTVNSGGPFYAPAQVFRQQPQVQRSQQQLQPQVVRQEHHYHYYNNQQTPPEQRQAPVQTQTVSTPSQVQPTIIRELQPIMISQPLVQSTTAAPPQTIIREIVKEIPAPTRFVQLVQPQQPTIVQVAPSPAPPIGLPPQIMREITSSFETPDFGRSSVAYGGQVPRIIRQLSGSLPQVAVRMPPTISQLRLQIPNIQLPALRSNPAPVTRQTGSFIIPPMPKKTTTYMTETQVLPTHTTIMQTTQFTPATKTTVYTTDHQQPVDAVAPTRTTASGYK